VRATRKRERKMKNVQHKILHKTQDNQGDIILNRFDNGLIIKTESPFKKDPFRILGIGNPQISLMSYMLNSPEIVLGKDVFEPFGGSGPLGLMALKMGARYVEFLDINPRAVEFQAENAKLNNFNPDSYKCILYEF